MAYRTVQFGTTYGSLGTVGYRLRSSGGTWGSRVTAGVSEEATGSGTYTANVDESSLPVQIKWDTTDGSTVNAIEDITPQYASIGTGPGQFDLSTGRVKPADSSLDPATPTADFAAQFISDLTDSTKAEARAAIVKINTYLNGTTGGTSSVSDIN